MDQRELLAVVQAAGGNSECCVGAIQGLGTFFLISLTRDGVSDSLD